MKWKTAISNGVMCSVRPNDRGWFALGEPSEARRSDRGTNMHRLWDSDMIERTDRSEDAWLADLAALDTPENRNRR